MKHYDNGCARSEVKVTPSNWKTQKASTRKKWKIYYRYYDPAFKGKKKWGQMIQIRRMNEEKDLIKRQMLTKLMLESELDRLDNRLLNPITATYHTPLVQNIEEITPSTPFIEALKQAHKMLTCCPEMKKDIEIIIDGISETADKLFDQKYYRAYKALRIAQISRKHYVYIFKQRALDNSRFTPNRQNKYRTALIMLYKKLLEVEAVEADPVSSLPIAKGGLKKIPVLLSEAERLIIDTNLKAWDYPFWRYVRIFHRSGCRSTELFDLKNDGSVNLETQEFKVVVKKGKVAHEAIRPIPDDILPLWIELLEQTPRGEYLFSTSFKPGPTRQFRDAPTKKWNKYVSNDPGKYDPLGLGWGLGIKVSFYKLKALNTDTIAAKLDIEAAAAADGHQDIKTTRKYYAPNEEARQRERLKRLDIPFA